MTRRLWMHEDRKERAIEIAESNSSRAGRRAGLLVKFRVESDSSQQRERTNDNINYGLDDGKGTRDFHHAVNNIFDSELLPSKGDLRSSAILYIWYIIRYTCYIFVNNSSILYRLSLCILCLSASTCFFRIIRCPAHFIRWSMPHHVSPQFVFYNVHTCDFCDASRYLFSLTSLSARYTRNRTNRHSFPPCNFHFSTLSTSHA